MSPCEAEYNRVKQGVLQTFQRDSQACDAEFTQTKQQIDDQFKKEQRAKPRRSRKKPAGRRWPFTKDRVTKGPSGGAAPNRAGPVALDHLHAYHDHAAILLEALRQTGGRQPRGRSDGDGRWPSRPR